MNLDVDMSLPHSATDVLAEDSKADDILAETLTVEKDSRQKSCENCVRGKRKCDKNRPRCGRCAARGVDCVYCQRPPKRKRKLEVTKSKLARPPTAAPPAPPAATTMTTRMPAQQLPLPAIFDPHSHGPPAFSAEIDVHFDEPALFHAADQDLSLVSAGGSPSGGSLSGSLGGSGGSSGSGEGSPLMSFPPPHQGRLGSGSPDTSGTGSLGFDETYLDFSVIDFMPTMYGNDDAANLWLNQCVDVPEMPAFELLPKTSASVEEDCIRIGLQHYQPCQVKDPRSRMGYVVRSIKESPALFAQTRATPFIHPHLYRARTPRAITHAWTTCTVYTARTPATESWASRVVVEGSAAVLRSPEPTSALDRLARVQALLLYLIIKVFDGDVMLGAQAERELPTLLHWVDELARARTQLEPEMWADSESRQLRPPKSWERWILQESMRRTVIKCYCFIGVFEILKGRSPPRQVFHEGQVFTVSRHLWEAETSANFFYAWREKPQHLIFNMNFVDFVDAADPDDVDEFGKLFLLMKLGSEAAEKFLSPGMLTPCMLMNDIYGSDAAGAV